MKLLKTFAAALTASTIAGSAFAADLPSRRAPMAVAPLPIMTWSGFYIGINLGGAFGGSNNGSTFGSPVSFNPGLAGGAASEAAIDAAVSSFGLGGNRGGFLGGGQIGWNYQFSPSFVAGIEADIQGIAASNTGSSFVGAAPIVGFGAAQAIAFGNVSNKLSYLGTVRGRLGFLATPTFLLYATGGLAYGGVKSSTTVFLNFPATAIAPAAAAGSASTTRVGYTVGAGLEWMFAPNWSLKAEYLYYDLGRFSYNTLVSTVNTAGVPFTNDIMTTSVRNNGHIVRAGVNYHFNWGYSAPVVAKY